jgi:hypothetical protein
MWREAYKSIIIQKRNYFHFIFTYENDKNVVQHPFCHYLYGWHHLYCSTQ